MRKSKFRLNQIMAVFMFASFFIVGIALAENQADKATVTTGGSTNSPCPGVYYAYAKMTNSTGSFWITPPTNASSGTLTDISGFAAPYVSVAQATRFSDKVSWCDSNSVTFPATNSTKYSLTVYVKSTTPPPTNGQPMILQIQWQ